MYSLPSADVLVPKHKQMTIQGSDLDGQTIMHMCHLE